MDKLPLKGIRVIDLSHSWAGPHCSRILADFGAEVIKVEYPRRLCLLRGAKTEEKAYNHHTAWSHINRNKYAITLDLKVEKDGEIFSDMIKTSDVLMENSRTGVMEKLGFGYEDLIKIKPDLIMLSMTAFGQTGPFARYAGYGAVMESLGGIQSLTAYSGATRPTRVKEVDVANGVAGASSIMNALLYRQMTGEGQYIDMSQLEAATHGLIGEHLLAFSANKTQWPPMGNRHPVFAPQGCYRCGGEDKWVVITIGSEDEWQRFLDVLAIPELKEDGRFASRSLRAANHGELDGIIEQWTMERTNEEAMRTLQSHGISAAAVLSVAELSENSHLKDREYFVGPVEGSNKLFMGMPFKFSKASGRVQWQGPDLGQHNEYVVCEMLGRKKNDVPIIREDEIGTAYDPK